MIFMHFNFNFFLKKSPVNLLKRATYILVGYYNKQNHTNYNTISIKSIQHIDN